MLEESKPPFPPFNAETAAQKVRMAENGWNNRKAEAVSRAYSLNSRWRNRSEYINGRSEIQDFLTRKWAKEHEYRLIKELWAYSENKISVRFAYEWHDDAGNWFRSYGNENWEFDEWGLMTMRHACINDLEIKEGDRLFCWAHGPRPEGHASLSELGL